MGVGSSVVRQAGPVLGRFSVWSRMGTRRVQPVKVRSRDEFLHPGGDLRTLPPGTILRSRRVELALFGLVPQRVSAWQLVYRSTDMHGHPEVAVTTVVLPADADPDVERPLLAFESAIDAVTERSAPSYALRRGSRAHGSITPIEWPMMIANAVRRGWAVSISDHGGPQGNFGAPREPGYRTLDGVRAALSFEALGLVDGSPIVVWGYSGGGMAASWTVEMAPAYAPELDITAAVLGAPVGDPAQVLVRLSGGLFAGFPAMVIAALRRLYPVVERVIDAHMRPGGYRLLEQAKTLTPLLTLLRLAGRDFDDHLDRPLADILAEPEMTAMLDDLRLGGHAPACPLLVVQPVHDQVIHRECVDAQVNRYRDHGATVVYVRDRLSEHFSMMALSTPLALNWLSDRLAGLPITESGTRTVWSIATAPGVWRGYLEMADTALRVMLGMPLRDSRTQPGRRRRGGELRGTG